MLRVSVRIAHTRLVVNFWPMSNSQIGKEENGARMLSSFLFLFCNFLETNRSVCHTEKSTDFSSIVFRESSFMIGTKLDSLSSLATFANRKSSEQFSFICTIPYYGTDFHSSCFSIFFQVRLDGEKLGLLSLFTLKCASNALHSCQNIKISQRRRTPTRVVELIKVSKVADLRLNHARIPF